MAVEYLQAKIDRAPLKLDGESAPIESISWVWRDPRTIPPRRWLLDHHYMRGMVSATAGIGGAGKTSLLLVEALSLATGVNLLSRNEPLLIGPQPVWVHNEDPLEELERRLAAICIAFRIDPEVVGNRMHLTSARSTPIMIAKPLEGGGKMLLPTGDGSQIAEEIKRKGIAAFFVDPFVSVHKVAENDNVLIDQVMRILSGVAEETDCAVELAHHFRKANGQEPSADDVRGASSIIGACRSVRLLVQMSAEEAEAFGLEKEERKKYVYLQNGKSNMAPPLLARRWFELTSIDLDNALPPYLADSVGVAMPWSAPQKAMELTGPEWRAVRVAIRNATNPLAELRYDQRSSGWAGARIAKALELEPAEPAVRIKMKALIEGWIRAKRIKVTKIADPRQARSVQVIEWVETEVEE